MNNFLNEGDVIDLTAPYAVASGGGVLVGSIFGVAVTAIANGASGPVKTKGMVSLNTDTGTAWNQGDVVYWDNTAKQVTKTATNNKLIGAAATAKLSAATSCAIKLNGTTVS